MTAAGTSKLEARRRAVEANRRANEARAARDKANVKDATTFMYEVGKIVEIELWKKERLVLLREQVEAEAAKKVATHRAKAGAAVARMQDRGETLTTIAENSDVGIGIVRTMLGHASKNEKTARSDGSHALGVGGAQTDSPPGRGDGEADRPRTASA
ncbi:hypothetical protein [Mycobacterium sp. 236(2023)]|uniref:hypothetical protein n=1 Tax=Mycobacterium sp. 236(2023) TaxID=3038163 RepID=UPI002414DD12|nr:hypothetical protein [Mycobacterium sp. 236(2023)]MDG4666369.1 hypothetical protein [Mycobacterium sp. 236(2023)]